MTVLNLDMPETSAGIPRILPRSFWSFHAFTEVSFMSMSTDINCMSKMHPMRALDNTSKVYKSLMIHFCYDTLLNNNHKLQQRKI